MSHEIEDLIANFEDKFDTQFNYQKPEPLQENSNQDNHEGNPQTSPNKTPEENPNSKKQVRIIKHYDVNHEVAIDESDKGEELQVDAQKTVKKQFYEDQGEENRYRDLSNKLETALKKISSTSKVMTSSHVRSTGMLSRFDDYQKKKQKDLAQKQKNQEEKRYHGLRDRPEINERSKQLVAQIHRKPIHERYQTLVDERKKKVIENEELKKKKQEKEYEEFLEEFQSHNQVSSINRDTNKFFENMKSWQNKVEKERIQKMEEKQKKQIQGLTFKPKINKTSEKILQNVKRVPIQEREVQKVQISDPQLTFKPNLKKKKVK